MRRTIIRYINLCLILTFRLICLPVKKRFPTLQHLEDAGILQGRERLIFEKMDRDVSTHPKYWMPLVWAGSIVTRARKENRIANDYMMMALIEQIDKFRGMAGACLNYDWVCIPLVYTQVVTLAVYTFLLSTLMGRQFLDPEKSYPGHEVDLVFPAFTILQFFFYMGWLKVAEALINPYGEDDDDFEVNWMIDRNLQVSYLIVDEMHAEHPEMVRDQFWEDLYPELPYTAAAEETRTDPIIGSTANYEVPSDEAEFLPLSSSEDEDEGSEDRFNLLKNSQQDLTEVVVDNLVRKKKGGGGSASKSSSKHTSPKRSKRRPSEDSDFVSRSKPIEIHPSIATVKRGEFGSILSVNKRSMNRPLAQSAANSNSGISLVSRLHSVIRGNRGGPGSVFGNSHISLMSRASRQAGKRSRKPSSLMGRSTSRVSNNSQTQDGQDNPLCNDNAPSNVSESESHSEEESMFKFSRSSMSSVDHLHESSNDLVNRRKNSRDLRRRKKHSLPSGLQSPGVPGSSKVNEKVCKNCPPPGSPRGSITRGTGSFNDYNQALIRKLELMHNFTSEAVRLLRTESDSGIHAANRLDDSQYMFSMLEQNHEELRQLLLKRLNPRPQRNSTVSTTVGSPPSTSGDPAMGEAGSGPGTGEITNNAFQYELEKPLEPSQVGDDNSVTSMSNDGNLAIDEDLEEEEDKSQEGSTVMYNDNLSVQDHDSSVSPLEDETNSGSNAHGGATGNEPEEHATTWNELDTIEEQPELGYTSETEYDSYKDSSKANRNKKNTLDPLLEENLCEPMTPEEPIKQDKNDNGNSAA